MVRWMEIGYLICDIELKNSVMTNNSNKSNIMEKKF